MYVRSNTGPVYVRENIMFNQFSHGVHAFSQGSDGLKRVIIEGNISFNNGSISAESSPNILLGGTYTGAGYAADDDTVQANRTYRSPSLTSDHIPNIRVGWGSPPNQTPNGDLWLLDNYSSGGEGAIDFREWATAVVTGNKWHSDTMVVRFMDETHGGYNCSSNTHYRDPAKLAWYYNWSRSFSSWQSAINPTCSTDQTAALPTTPVVFVRPINRDGAPTGLGTIAIYNWTQSTLVPVDLSPVLDVNDVYEVRNVQQLGTVVASGTYAGGDVNIPMPGVSNPPLPIGGGNPRPPLNTGAPGGALPRFDAFVIKQIAPDPQPPAFTATIVGPTEMQPDTECFYDSNVSGGTPPYSYQWFQSGSPVGTGSSVVVSSAGFVSSFLLTLSVTDAGGLQRSDELTVQINESAPICPAR